MLTLFHIHPPRLHTLHLAVTQWNGLGNLQHRRLQRPARKTRGPGAGRSGDLEDCRLEQKMLLKTRQIC